MTPHAGRVLGCLVEKQLTTPQHYPLSLNATALAASQSTNREPVMSLDDQATEEALQELKALRLVRFVLPSHGKSVTRYRHVLDEHYGLDTARVALVAVLLLRGPQTVGELRTRTGRMIEFDSLDAVHAELAVLAGQPEPLVRLLPRRPGQKEERWQQLLADEPGAGGALVDSVVGAGVADGRSFGMPSPVEHAGDGRASSAVEEVRVRDDLEQRVEALVGEVAALREELRAVTDSLEALRESLGG
jgi:hypothetical protein